MDASHRPARVALLGLGEAGRAFAGDLVAAGIPTAGWDPAPGRPVPGLRRAQDALDAIAEAELVLSLNSAPVAVAVATSVAPSLSPGCLFADLNTSGVAVKREIAEIISSAGASFADVALLSPVPGRGLRTPSFVSGDGAEDYARILRSFGAQVEVLSVEPGVAAARKLLRSVFMKGLAASVLESLAAAEAAGCAGWLRADIAATLRDADESLVDRLVEGSAHHAVRRIAEMEAAAELLRELGVEPHVARAAIDVLHSLPSAPST
jgi:3-hydroxyisobutyrate dehydrogenase-like beta-hydroxyacid dehydrogenase